LLIGIDVGNTNITVGIFADTAGELTPLQAWRFTTKQYMTADEMAAPIITHLMHAGYQASSINAGVVACVVPSLERSLHIMLEGVFGLTNPLFVDSSVDCGLQYAYPNPSEIGADRIVNAAAGIALYGTPLLIIDFGTATTFCCISRDGKYLGGQILPGVEISLQALTTHAEKLSSVSIVRPRQVIGKSTADGMAAGIYYQTMGALELITRRIREEMQEPDLKIVATGGLAGLFSTDWSGITVIDQDLTLKGLKLIHERRAALPLRSGLRGASQSDTGTLSSQASVPGKRKLRALRQPEVVQDVAWEPIRLFAALLAPEHIDAILAIENATYSSPWSRAMIESEIETGQANFWVFFLGSAIVAYGGFWNMDGDGNITRITVAEEYRGRKIGTSVLTFLLSEIARLGLESASLEVRASNSTAIAFYESAGFALTGQRRKYYDDGETALIYAKKLI